MADMDSSRGGDEALVALLASVTGILDRLFSVVEGLSQHIAELEGDEDLHEADEDALLSDMPSGPGEAGVMPYWRYRLYLEDGSEVGDTEYVDRIKAGEVVWFAGGRKFRVLDVIEAMADDGFLGLLRVVPV